MRFGGVDHEGFRMKGGVRQGCPLSLLLFAVCVDILLRRLEQTVPQCMCRAFADDIALVLQDWWIQGPTVQQLFKEFFNVFQFAFKFRQDGHATALARRSS